MGTNDSAAETGTSTGRKILIAGILLIAIGSVLYAKRAKEDGANGPVYPAPESTAARLPEAVPPVAQGAVSSAPEAVHAKQSLPRLVDVGASQCIPCKLMAPILAELRQEYAGKMDVEFVDVWKDPDAGKGYDVLTIPTQIFYDASGQERFRHQGFLAKEDILEKWAELGVDVGAPATPAVSYSRWEPAQPDSRAKDQVCYLCDGDIDPRTRTVLNTPAGEVAFCSPHCYIITYASLTDPEKSHEKASTTDWATGALTPVMASTYLHGVDAKGRPSVKAFAESSAATAEQQSSGGNILAWDAFESKETSTRCAFCDRPVYPEDASVVRVDGMQTWACCVMCALGVAARTGSDIGVEAQDALTGEALRLSTYELRIAQLEPATMVAWAGATKDATGTIRSTGCFKQAFFANEDNLKQWVEQHPTATGQLVSIRQALMAKLKLTPEEIGKACKIGECSPK